MKITKEGSIFVQKNDITFLNHTDLAIPASIIRKVFGNGVVIIDDRNRYEFIEFNTPEEIEFFQSLDWIVDYDKVKDLSEEETIALAQSISDERNEIAKMFNSMSSEDRKQNEDMLMQFELLGFKMYSLRDILWFKQGHIKMVLPGQENGFKKLIKTIFNKIQK